MCACETAGITGSTYANESGTRGRERPTLPAELVWVHVALATLTWLAMLYTVASAGRLALRTAHEPERRAPEPELAGVS